MAPLSTARRQVLAVIAVGGVLGAEARFGVSTLLPHDVAGFPWATLVVNASGCLLIGVLMTLIVDAAPPHRLLRPFVGVGILGGYTTFSTYTVDIQHLLTAGRPAVAVGYLAGTAVVALAAVWAGVALTRVSTRHASSRAESRARRAIGAARPEEGEAA